MTPGLGVSYGVLVVAQGALVLAPLESRERRRVVAVGLLAPVAALGLGVGLLRGFATSPRALAVLAAVATPVLAAASGWFLRGRRPWLSAICAGGLYLLAWQSSSLAGQAAGMILIGLACLTLAGGIAYVAPRRSIEAGLVLLAVLDAILVWGTPQVGPATTALAHTTVPTFALPLLPHRALPSLQQVGFGSATMGWLDFLAPALLCAAVVRRARPRAAIATAAAAGLWGVLLFVTSTVPATVPVVVGLLAAHVGRSPVVGVQRRATRSRSRGADYDRTLARFRSSRDGAPAVLTRLRPPC